MLISTIENKSAMPSKKETTGIGLEETGLRGTRLHKLEKNQVTKTGFEKSIGQIRAQHYK